jgi:hypothetical protein
MNAIVYSVYVDNGNLSDNYNFEQFKTSLATLRKFNLDIPVKVYISAPEANDIQLINSFNDNHLEFIQFDLKFDKRLTGGIYTKWTAHKWPNTLDALKRFDLDNVLYIDTDTFFQKDPAYLFSKYGNTHHVWGKSDVEKIWPERFGLDYLGMNDGQQLLSKYTLPFLQDLINTRDDLVYDMQEKHKDSNDEKLYVAIQYIYGQYAVSEFLKSINNPLKHFDDDDVLVMIDPNLFDSLSNKNEITLVHFCNINMQRFDPKAFEVYKKNNLDGK